MNVSESACKTNWLAREGDLVDSALAGAVVRRRDAELRNVAVLRVQPRWAVLAPILAGRNHVIFLMTITPLQSSLGWQGQSGGFTSSPAMEMLSNTITCMSLPKDRCYDTVPMKLIDLCPLCLQARATLNAIDDSSVISLSFTNNIMKTVS